MKQIIVIPVRMSGKRLPGKPLIKINKKPMIQHVYERCLKVMSSDKVYIATEDQVIVDFCKKEKMNVVKTKKAPTAIYRIKLVSDIIKADSYINIQGDEPLVNISDIKKLLSYNLKNPLKTVFGKTKCSEKKANDLSKAKVVCSKSGKLLYSSRSVIPFVKKNYKSKFESAVWLYAFNKTSLDLYAKNYKKSSYDKLEGNEILSFIENDMDVHCINMSSKSWAVDEPKDVKIVEKLLKNA